MLLSYNHSPQLSLCKAVTYVVCSGLTFPLYPRVDKVLLMMSSNLSQLLSRAILASYQTVGTGSNSVPADK